MKKIIDTIVFYLIRSYSKNRFDRQKIYTVLHEECGREFNEDNMYDNLEQSLKEFFLTSPVFKFSHNLPDFDIAVKHTFEAARLDSIQLLKYKATLNK